MTGSPAALLREAVERFDRPDLEGNAKAVLKRLVTSEDGRAAEAIAAITDDLGPALRVVRCCLECDALCRTFHSAVEREEQTPARLDALETGTKNSIDFIRELAAGPSHPLDAFVYLDPATAERLLIVQNELLGLIRARRRVAAETPLRFGATQKRHTEDAGETAAIGWLASGIENVTGKPHYRHTATLAEIVLQANDAITIDRVRDALRTRRQRPWRND